LNAAPRRDLSVPLPVRVSRDDGQLTTDYAVNVTSGGLCLHTRQPLSVGETLSLAFRLPPDGPEVTCRARVVWIAPGQVGVQHYEAGVCFDDLDAAVSQRLDDYATHPSDPRR
jgi:uncharacterized protein (TIGR02266 family)